MSKFKITVEEQIIYTHEIEVETAYSEAAVDNILCEIDEDLTRQNDIEYICSELEARDIKVLELTNDGHGVRGAIRIIEMEEEK